MQAITFPPACTEDVLRLEALEYYRALKIV
jgi:hypothetical protein